MKTLKTSNIILIFFGIAILIFVIAQVVKSTYYPNSNSENAMYSTLETYRIESFQYLVLDGYREVTYEVKTGKQLKVEVFTDLRNSDSCKINFSNDTLYLNVVNSHGYTNSSAIPDVKITVPQGLAHILIKNAFCDINSFQQDTLNISVVNAKTEFNSEKSQKYSSEYKYINLKNCNLKTFTYSGGNSELSIDKSNTITELNFNSKGKDSRLNLNDVFIGNLNLNQDSAEVILSGKAIQYYLKK
jgi:hypothetical protein